MSKVHTESGLDTLDNLLFMAQEYQKHSKHSISLTDSILLHLWVKLSCAYSRLEDIEEVSSMFRKSSHTMTHTQKHYLLYTSDAADE